MRIALYHNLPSGGAKRSLYEQVKRLATCNEIDVYSLETADHDFCDLRPWVRVHKVYPFSMRRLFASPFGRLNQLQRWRDLHALVRLSQRIAQDIDRRNYDIAFVEPCFICQAPYVLSYLQTPSVYFCQEPPRDTYDRSFRPNGQSNILRTLADRADPLIPLYFETRKKLDKMAARSATRVLVNSEFMCGIVADLYGIWPLVCYLGVDKDLFRPQVDAPRQPHLLSVGGIQPHKGFDFIIHSIARIPPKLRPPLHLIGNVASEDEQRRLEALACQMQVTLRIEVGVTLSRLVRCYNEARLFAYAPYNEPFGLAALEAMACGTPVVGISEGGVRETVIHGVTGLLTERDPVQFAQAIETLITDPVRAEQLGRQARATVLERWAWDTSVAHLEKHLRATFASRSSVES